MSESPLDIEEERPGPMDLVMQAYTKEAERTFLLSGWRRFRDKPVFYWKASELPRA